jgi:hypothetical protein
VKTRIAYLLVAALLTLNVTAQSPRDTLSPHRVVEKYVSTKGFPDKLRFFCCEMYHEWAAPKTLGEQLAPSVKREVHLLYQDTGRAVVTVWLHDSITSMDVYFYLQHREVWTVYAVRSLVMKAEAEKELLRLDSIPEKLRGKTYKQKWGHTWKFDHDNVSLWNSSDSGLATYYYSHADDFRALEKLRQQKYPLAPDDSVYKTVMNDKKIRKKADALLIRDIIVDKHAPGTVLYFIGGILDNSVGYMYQPDPMKVPKPNAGYFILVRPLGNGWYLYKTT